MDTRKLSEIKNVIYDKKWVELSPDIDLYFMDRRVKVENGLVRNITTIPAKMLGSEYIKTKGHVHIGNFKEIYTVLEGQAIFLMQKTNNETVQDAYAVKAKAGESAIIPAGYGHVTINPSETEDLKTGDWTADGCEVDYSLFEKLQGACYYYTANGWIKNENYKNVPELRFEESLKSIPENLDFLKK